MKKKSIPLGGFFGPLFPYINSYLTRLRGQGYAHSSLRARVLILKLFDRWLNCTGRGVQDLNEAVACHFLRRVLKRRYQNESPRSALRQLLALLRGIEATPAAQVTPLSPSEKLVCDYERFLIEERNLASLTREHLRRFAAKLLSEKFGAGSLKLFDLSAADVTSFVQRHAHQHSPNRAKQLVSGTRSFLRYLHYKGLIDADLSLVVPKVACWSFSTLPKHLSGEQVEEVLCHCERRTSLGRRNYAILLLLARLGLRAGEVAGLNLENIDWENARITVCGKGKKWAQLPLPADVGQAIGCYLRHERPRCACRSVFLSHNAPIRGIRQVSIAHIVRSALAKAGVESAGKGAHLLRHSLATDMLRKGASLDEIGEVLRHGSPDSTTIYAKVDLKSLRALALSWPGGVQ